MNIGLGVVGLVTVCIGALLKTESIRQKVTFLVGTAALFLYALLDRSRFFTALEVVAVVGCVIAFFRLSTSTKFGITSLTAVGALAWLIVSGDLNGLHPLIGAVGLTLLAVGFAVSNPLWFFTGSIGIVVFSAWSFFLAPSSISLVFGVLNVFFAGTSLRAATRFLRERSRRKAAAGCS